MARLAATDFGADWVINSDADEFWWPRGASLRTVLEAIPARYGTVGAFLRTFAPRPDGDEPFAERLTVRFSALAPINDPASLYKPIRKVIHRGAPADHADARKPRRRRQPFAPLRGWFPVEVLHFPLRSSPVRAQGAAQGSAWSASTGPRPPTTPRCSRRSRVGTIGDYYDAQVVDGRRRSSAASRRGGLVVDTRLRDALRQLGEAAHGAGVPDTDARRRGDVRGRGRRSRRGGRRAPAAAPRRARAAPRHRRAPPAEPDLPQARGAAKRVLGRQRLTARSPTTTS